MRLKVSNVCQLLDKSKYPATKTENGITWTNNGDGTITTNGTATNRSVLMLKTGLRVNAGKYCVLGKVGTVAIGIDVFVDDVYSSSPFADNIFTIDKESVLNVYPVVENGDSANSITIKPQIFNLTEMYGIGNEPTTVAQFRQDFPNEMYDYSPECWKKIRRLKYVTETKNLLKLNDFSNSWLTIKNNTIRIKKTSDLQSYSGAIFSPLQTDLKSDKYYRISAKVIGEFTGRLYKFFGNSLWGNAINNNRWQSPFTLANIEDKYGLAIHQNSGTTVGCTLISDEVFIYDIMLEEGDAAFVGQAEYVPSGYLPLNRGKYIANKQPVQLLDKSKYRPTITSEGITYTPNIEDGTWTITGTGTNFSFCSIQSLRVGVDFEVGDKLLLRNSSRNDTTYFPFAPYYGSNMEYLGEKDGEGIFTVLNNTVRIHVQLTTRVTGVALNITTQVQVFNLTRMYGKGNEPTAAEFVAQYPGFDYSVNKYNAITFR